MLLHQEGLPGPGAGGGLARAGGCRAPSACRGHPAGQEASLSRGATARPPGSRLPFHEMALSPRATFLQGQGTGLGVPLSLRPRAAPAARPS